MRKLLILLALQAICTGMALAVSKTWTGAISTNWGLANNWNPSGIPQNGDDVTIPSSATRMPTYAAGTVTLNTLTVNGTLTITGGTLNVTNDSTLATVNLQGGTLGGTADFTLSNTLNWSGGTLAGSALLIVTGSATVNITGNPLKILDTRGINNSGTINWSGTGNISGVNNPTLTNQISGVFNIQSEADWTGNGTINNQSIVAGNTTFRGIVNKNNTSATEIAAVFNNNGQVTVQNGGDLRFLANGTHGSRGIFTCSGMFVFAGGEHTLNTGSLVQGTGQLHVRAAEVNCNGTYNMTTPLSTIGTLVSFHGLLNFNAASTLQSLGQFVLVTGSSTLNLSSGEFVIVQRLDLEAFGELTGSDTLRVSNQCNWSSGRMSGSGITEIPGSSVLNISGSDFKNFGGTRTINAFGNTIWTGGDVVCTGSPVFNNLPNADFIIQTDADWRGTGTFNNTGDLLEGQFGDVIKTNVNSNQTDFVVVFNNDGRVQIQLGTLLSLQGGGVSNGMFDVGSGGALRFEGGTHTLNLNSLVQGTGQVLLSAGTVNCNGTYNMTTAAPRIGTAVTVSGVLNFNPSSTLQSLGQIVAVAGGSLNLSSGEAVNVQQFDLMSQGTLTGSDTLRVSNQCNWSGGTMRGTGTTLLLNTSTLNINGNTLKSLDDTRLLRKEGAGSWIDAGNVSCGVGARFENFSIFNMTTDADWTSGNISNVGSLNLLSSVGEKTVGAVVSNLGAINVQAVNAHLHLTNTFSQAHADASLFVRQSATLTSDQNLNIVLGSLTTGPNGTATIIGNVNNIGGKFRPGGELDMGIVSLQGSWSQGTNAELNISLGGTDNTNPVDPEYDQIIVPGDNRTVILNGKLILRRVGGYLPTLCDEFTLIQLTGQNNAQITDEFDEVEFIDFDNTNHILEVIYEPRAVILRVAQTIPGDVNGDRCANDADLLIVLFNFGGDGDGDLNCDDIVNDVDLLEVLFNFGNGC